MNAKAFDCETTRVTAVTRSLFVLVLIMVAGWCGPALADMPTTITIDGNLPDGGNCTAIGSWDDASNRCTVESLELHSGTTLSVANASLRADGELRSLGAHIDNLGEIDLYGGFFNAGTVMIHAGAELTTWLTATNRGRIDNEGHFLIESSLYNEPEGLIHSSGFFSPGWAGDPVRNAGTIISDGYFHNVHEFVNLATGTVIIGVGGTAYGEGYAGPFTNHGRWENFGWVHGIALQFDNYGVLENHASFMSCEEECAHGVVRNHGTINNYDSLAICENSQNYGTINNAGEIIERFPRCVAPGIIENSGLIQDCGSIELTVSGNVPVPDQDGDSDGFCNGLDCAPADPSSWRTPDDVRGLRLTHAGGEFGVTTLDWVPPLYPGGTATLFDVLSSDDPEDLLSSSITTCVETDDASDTTAIDSVTPWANQVACFIVRAGNVCGEGPAGNGSDGAPRVTRVCP